VFFQHLSNGLVRDRFDVNLVEGDEMLGEKMKRPARPSFRWVATSQRNEMGFGASVEFALVDAVGLAAINRRQAVLCVPFPDATNRSWMTADGLTDLLVSQAIIGVQQTPCTRENACFVRSSC